MSEWDLVGGNPAPGATRGIEGLANEIARIGDRAHDAHMQFQTVVTNVSGDTAKFEGAAQTQFAQIYESLPRDLGYMWLSYRDVTAGLNDYAHRLEDLQAEAGRVLERARFADGRRRTSEAELHSASERFNQLQQSLFGAQVLEKTLYGEYLVESAAAPPAEAARLDYERARDERLRLEAQRNSTRGEVNRHSQEVNQFRGEFRNAESRIHDIRETRRAEESRAAGRIRDALGLALRDRTFGEDAAAFVKEVGTYVLAAGVRLAEADFDLWVPLERALAELMKEYHIQEIHFGVGNNYFSFTQDGTLTIKAPVIGSEFSVNAEKRDITVEALGSGFSKKGSVFALMVGAPIAGGTAQSITAWDTKNHTVSEEIRVSGDAGGGSASGSLKFTSNYDTGEIKTQVEGQVEAHGVEAHAGVSASTTGTVSSNYGASAEISEGPVQIHASADHSITKDLTTGEVTVKTSSDTSARLSVPFGDQHGGGTFGGDIFQTHHEQTSVQTPDGTSWGTEDSVEVLGREVGR
jgi:hypothetical protein